LTTTDQNILSTLGYFDIFNYPLTREEIYLFHPDNTATAIIDQAIAHLLAEQLIFEFNKYYALQNDFSMVEKRCRGNFLAIDQMRTARKVAALLSKFPFVKAIAVSGSLSKNVATENSDIDFFIVTAANRLWIARTLMHLYKKMTFLTGRQHWFCMNYYVDEAEPEIAEKNIFTAMEIITLIPLWGKKSMHDFFNGNAWAKKYFPMHNFSAENSFEIKRGIFRRLLEKTLAGSFGNAIDERLMRITGKRWKKKTQNHELNSKGITMGMAVGKHYSKPDPKNFQDKVINQYVAKVNHLLQPKKTGTVQL
jgi:predicted nucleotidyltransferase